jgi:hypothetical protein
LVRGVDRRPLLQPARTKFRDFASR